jgi:hypothetical protein
MNKEWDPNQTQTNLAGLKVLLDWQLSINT